MRSRHAWGAVRGLAWPMETVQVGNHIGKVVCAGLHNLQRAWVLLKEWCQLTVLQWENKTSSALLFLLLYTPKDSLVPERLQLHWETPFHGLVSNSPEHLWGLEVQLQDSWSWLQKQHREWKIMCAAAWRLTNMAPLFNRCEKVNPTNYGSINVILIEGKILG